MPDISSGSCTQDVNGQARNSAAKRTWNVLASREANRDCSWKIRAILGWKNFWKFEQICLTSRSFLATLNLQFGLR
jgi:hypothetical protein